MSECFNRCLIRVQGHGRADVDDDDDKVVENVVLAEFPLVSSGVVNTGNEKVGIGS